MEESFTNEKIFWVVSPTNTHSIHVCATICQEPPDSCITSDALPFECLQDTDGVHTLCPNKNDPLVDFLIACNKVYRIKHNFMNTYPYVLQRIVQSFWKIRLSVTQKSNFKQNRINV